MKDTTIDMLDILKKEGYSIQDINKFLLTKPIKELRDQFAMAALTGIISNAKTHEQICKMGNGLDKMTEITASAAYQYADAMLQQREIKTNE